MSDDHKNLKDLDEKIKKMRGAKDDAAKQTASSDEEKDDMRMGIRAGTELVVTIAAGTLIGYYLDQWLDTAPVFLIIFVLAGIGAGFFNIYRITEGAGSQVGFAPLHKNKKQGTKPAENENEHDRNDRQ